MSSVREKLMQGVLKRILTALWMGALAAGVQSCTDQATQTDAQQLRALDTEWPDAERRNDVAALDRILHPEFVFVALDGHVYDKAGFIKLVPTFGMTGTNTTTHEVTTIDGDTAVVVDSFVAHTANGDSPPIRATTTLVKRENRWRPLMQQVGPALAGK